MTPLRASEYFPTPEPSDAGSARLLESKANPKSTMPTWWIPGENRLEDSVRAGCSLCYRLLMYDSILPETSFSFLDLSSQLQITFLHSSQCTAHNSTCGEMTAWVFCHESCLQKRHLASPAGTPVLTRRGQE